MIKFNMKNIIIMLSLCMITSTIGVVTADCITNGKFVDDVDQKETENIVIDEDERIIIDENDTRDNPSFKNVSATSKGTWTNKNTCITYYSGTNVRGYLVDSDGKGIPYAIVEFYSFEGLYSLGGLQDLWKGSTQTNENGYFYFESLSSIEFYNSEQSIYYDGDHEHWGVTYPVYFSFK